MDEAGRKIQAEGEGVRDDRKADGIPLRDFSRAMLVGSAITTAMLALSRVDLWPRWLLATVSISTVIAAVAIRSSQLVAAAIRRNRGRD
jgi:hypothetical protein